MKQLDIIDDLRFGKATTRSQKIEEMHSVWKSQKKVSFNIASEASYVYILSGQKLIKNAKNGEFWQVF